MIVRKEINGNDLLMHEKCVLCSADTKIEKTKPVEERITYVEGVGQLCIDCFKKIM